MSGKLKYLAVATAAIGVLALVNTARTWNYRDDRQSLKSQQSASIVTGSVAPSSITTFRPIVGSDASISTYGLPEHLTDW